MIKNKEEKKHSNVSFAPTHMYVILKPKKKFFLTALAAIYLKCQLALELMNVRHEIDKQLFVSSGLDIITPRISDSYSCCCCSSYSETEKLG